MHAGQYNNQYSHVQASNYPPAPGPTRSRSSPQYGHGYGYQPLHGHPQEQGELHSYPRLIKRF